MAILSAAASTGSKGGLSARPARVRDHIRCSCGTAIVSPMAVIEPGLAASDKPRLKPGTWRRVYRAARSGGAKLLPVGNHLAQDRLRLARQRLRAVAGGDRKAGAQVVDGGGSALDTCDGGNHRQEQPRLSL